MVRLFQSAILGAFLCSLLGGASPTFGATATGEAPKPMLKEPPMPSKRKAPSIAKREDVKEAIPQKKIKADNSWIKNPPKTSSEQAVEKQKSAQESELQDTRDAKKTKTILIDARRLKDHKLTETIQYIKNNSDVRFKLHNMTIDPAFLVPMLTTLKQEQVLEKIKDIGFVMLDTANGKVLNEDVFVGKILPFLAHLDDLELLCLGATDKVVKAISTKIPNLKGLSLFGPGITDETVTNLSKECPNLTKIHLLNSHITASGIQALAKNFPKLEKLGISGPNLKDKDFVTLGLGKPNLRTLSIVGHNFKDMTTVVNLLKALPKLHTLDVSETNATDVVAKAIVENSKKLKSLNISETKITKEGVKEIVQTLDLTTFIINNLAGIGNAELELISRSQSGLRKFHFSGISFSDSGLIDVIWDLKKLTDVTLIPISGSKWVLSEAIARALVRKKNIQYLHIQADRLPENLRMEIENGIPNIRIEYK